MARIRTIKPEFPQSESMGDVSRDARLLFVELWTICDDEGRTRAASRMLASLLFPYDDDAPGLIDGWLEELEKVGCVVRYTSEGATYLQVCNWLSHQKIDKPSRSKIPAFGESSRIFSNPRESSSGDQGSRIKDQGGDQGESAPPAKPSPKRATALPTDFYPNESGLAYTESRKVSLSIELESFRNWHTAKGSTMKDWQAAWRTWCDKAVEFGRAGVPANARAGPGGYAQQRDAERREVGDILTGRKKSNERASGNDRDIPGECARVA